MCVTSSLRAGGCSGLDSSFGVENEPHPGDIVSAREGARTAVAHCRMAPPSRSRRSA